MPHHLVINADQTPLKYVPGGCSTLVLENSKNVALAGASDKRAITAQTLDGSFLPMLLIHKEKTSQSFTKITFPDGFRLSVN